MRGERDHYQPIHRNSKLTQSSQPETVLNDILQFYPFERIYIADLDAIRGKGYNRDALKRLAIEHSDLEFWLDDGRQLTDSFDLEANQRCVIGTESQTNRPTPITADYILSLDFADQPLGLEAWFSESTHWPKTLIAMTLKRVGSQQGPDFERLRHLMDAFPDHQWIAAGGVRDEKDLERLDDLGVAGVLLASALHQGQLTATTIAKWQAKKYPGKPGYFQQP